MKLDVTQSPGGKNMNTEAKAIGEGCALRRHLKFVL
jgi:hypothetical protein